MARVRHLTKAPITEALIDLRTVLPDAYPIEQLALARDKLRGKYPHVEEQRLFKATLQMEAAGQLTPATADLGLNGYVFRSEDRLTAVQFRRDGFTLNRLKPYTRWADLFPEARDLWRVYAEMAQVQQFTRVATRFINHLSLPGAPAPDFAAYLTGPPAIPPGAPAVPVGFLSRVVSRDPRTDLLATVTQATENALEPGVVTIILDIDVYKLGTFKPDDTSLDDTFDALHALKNEIFFGAITETTARKYE